MKIGSLLLFSALALVSAGSMVRAQVPNDLNIEGLMGKVKRIEEDTAEVKLKDGALKEGSRLHSRTLIFDKQGRITYEWMRIGKLTPSERFYSYKKEKCYVRTVRPGLSGSASKPLESFSLNVINYKPEENSLYREVFIGNSSVFDIKTQKYKYSFDSENRLLEEVLYSPEDQPVVKRMYVYTAERLPVEKLIGAVSGGRMQVIKYTYTLDSQGNWIKQVAENTLADAKATKLTKVTYRKISYYE